MNSERLKLIDEEARTQLSDEGYKEYKNFGVLLAEFMLSKPSSPNLRKNEYYTVAMYGLLHALEYAKIILEENNLG